MSHYTMLSKYSNCPHLLKIKNKLKIGLFLQIKLGIILDICGRFIPLVLVAYEMMIVNSALCASLAIYQLSTYLPLAISYPTHTLRIWNIHCSDLLCPWGKIDLPLIFSKFKPLKTDTHFTIYGPLSVHINKVWLQMYCIKSGCM